MLAWVGPSGEDLSHEPKRLRPEPDDQEDSQVRLSGRDVARRTVGELAALIALYALEGSRGRPPYPVEALLHIHFLHPVRSAHRACLPRCDDPQAINNRPPAN